MDKSATVTMGVRLRLLKGGVLSRNVNTVTFSLPVGDES